MFCGFQWKNTLMASRTVEDYLKHLCIAQQGQTGDRVSMGALARAVGVRPGTATAMIKTLSDSGLVEYVPRGGVRLSQRGEQLALHVLRRHRLVERFLVDVIGLDWSEVHEEAEELEHAISDKVLERIDDLLGRPTVDPHGDPIPTTTGTFKSHKLQSLADCSAGQQVRVHRVLDQGADFLRFAHMHGLRPGSQLRVLESDHSADAVTVQGGTNDTVTIGRGAAAKVMVQ